MGGFLACQGHCMEKKHCNSLQSLAGEQLLKTAEQRAKHIWQEGRLPGRGTVWAMAQREGAARW